MAIEIGKAGLSAAERVDFFRTLSGWLQSGGGRMPVAEAVSNTCDAFSHDEYKTLKPKMDMIAREVQGGQTRLFEALHMAKIGFQRQELSIIEAAERSSQLRAALPALVEALDIQTKARRELRSQLTMPVVIGIMLIFMSLGVLLFMLPLIIEPVLKRSPEALEKFPFILQWYWHASVWLRAQWGWLVAALVGLVLVFVLRNSPVLKPTYQAFLLKWNVSRKLILSFNAMVISYFMPALVRSGLPTYRVLQELAECVGNPTLSNHLKIAAQEHENGMRMALALRILPLRASFVNAVGAGERTGAIADRVEELQEPYRLEMERNIRQVVATLKFLVMAILLPFFIISTYTSLVGPIFALMEY